MAEKDKYIIKVEGTLVEVTPEVYYAYFRMERQERWQEEKLQGHDVVSYDALDNTETVGVEVLPDLSLPSMEEVMMSREIYEKLHRAVEALPKEESIFKVKFQKGAALLCNRESGRAALQIGEQNECKCELLRCYPSAAQTGSIRTLHEKGSGQNCRPDCEADRCRHYTFDIDLFNYH